METSDEAGKLTLTVGGSRFTVSLYDTEAARALQEMLPFTVAMEELNGNEKFYYFPNSLPADAERPGQIHTGDLMLYGNDCLVLFYKDFTSAYSYTRLGSVENIDGLAEALGSGAVEVIFE